MAKLTNSIIRAIADAREHGDLSENAEYHAARERQSLIEGQIADLEDKLARADTIDVSQLTGKQVKFGAHVVLADEDTGKEAKYQLVGQEEADIDRGLLAITSPLARALISASGWGSLPAELVAEVASELNVLDMASLSTGEGDLVDVAVKANFRSLGKRFGKQTQEVAGAIASTDAAALAAALRDGSATVEVPGLGTIELADEDVIVTETPREGWSVASGEGETVALDLHLTPELISLGTAREAVRLIQEARKSAGLDISDRITLAWTSANDSIAASLREHGDLIAGEVLATQFAEGPIDTGAFTTIDDDLALEFSLRKA